MCTKEIKNRKSVDKFISRWHIVVDCLEWLWADLLDCHEIDLYTVM